MYANTEKHTHIYTDIHTHIHESILQTHYASLGICS